MNEPTYRILKRGQELRLIIDTYQEMRLRLAGWQKQPIIEYRRLIEPSRYHFYWLTEAAGTAIRQRANHEEAAALSAAAHYLFNHAMATGLLDASAVFEQVVC